ncbi:unannotated protein [freshwater metagenome]|uniref:Unannotated protein n=1 Tax=freshwater metagenome TaxID=449393 RepID=A0A6J7EXI0_9ZZZZ|nr:hypothetical protein [Actinomycetota bacterium]
MSISLKFARRVALALSVGLILPSTAHAAPNSSGLYGSTDPLYDGVYRQSLSLLALAGAKVKPATSAIQWLVSQQCADGGYVSFRADISTPCDTTQEDSNSTAIAAAALQVVGKKAIANKSAAWLLAHRNRDGGIGFNPLSPATAEYDPTTSDANSTGLMFLALNTIYPKKYATAATSVLGKYQVGCSDGPGKSGALDYQRSDALVANDYATAQAAFAFTGIALPLIISKSTNAPINPCSAKSTSATKVADGAMLFLAARLTSNPRGIPSAFGPGTDWNTTAWATLALVGSGYRYPAISTAVAAMADGAISWGLEAKTNAAKPAALAMMLLVATALKLDVHHFGGIDLTKTIVGSLRS